MGIKPRKTSGEDSTIPHMAAYFTDWQLREFLLTSRPNLLPCRFSLLVLALPSGSTESTEKTFTHSSLQEALGTLMAAILSPLKTAPFLLLEGPGVFTLWKPISALTLAGQRPRERNKYSL